MINKISFYLLILMVICSANLYSQSNLSFEYDYCIFRNNDTSSFLELYYSFYQNELKLVRSDNVYQLHGFMDLKILNLESGETAIDQQYKVPLILEDTAGYKMNKLVGQIIYVLKEGKYELLIKASDYNDSLKNIVIKDSIFVGNYTGNVSSSSLQIASKIEKSTDKSNIFYKNSLEVTPNPSKIFGRNISDVYYYIEYYDLVDRYLTNDFTLVKIITDSDSISINSAKTDYKLGNNFKIEHGSFNVSDMKTGKYNFTIFLIDATGRKILETKNYFWVYNSVDTLQSAFNSYSMSEYKNYTLEQISDEVNKLIYIMDERYREKFDKTNSLELKRILLYEFWKHLDPDTLTKVNEFRISYFDRIKQANKNFKNFFMEGWKTDRGRIFLKYGNPDEIQRFPFESNKRAYEIWKYEAIQGGIDFIFVDLSNNDDNYVLVHSTAIGEISDSNWQDKLK